MNSMYLWFVLLFSAVQLSCAKSLGRNAVDGPDELVLVHTIFRHGNRTPENNIYDTNPYGDERYYKPYGYAQLTNVGKRTEYKIGKALRNRYEDFLGYEYNINLIDARSTNVNRTKMSLLLVLSGLFPPRDDLIWDEDLNWQPIPYNYFEKDKELSGRKVCTNYKKTFKKLVKSKKIQDRLVVYKDTFNYLTKHTGQDISAPKDAADVYLELMAQEAYGYPIEEWTYKYMPEMKQLNIVNYYLMTNTTELRKGAAGYLIQKWIEDTYNKISDPLSPTKIFLYSAHDKNIANLLLTLGIFEDDKDVPSFGCYLIAEVRKINGVYGLKFYYQNYNEAQPVLKIIPGCEEFCPLDRFKALTHDVIPEHDYCQTK